eukprot:CAMPEP_0113845880 /NCGR_PEP_ID=MMETSP0372-20130328/998_1 /TAXON_ID=340204 /ORGANISM="Lankesteria abbotti" /LENGTH=334 /DNA_ID=CAMNT_0000814963 /DNA_START=71 /DNA_END=1075 /DNA_ORIENTATION=+ /assembly_acc=CAM_ASM_000359
MDSGRSGVGNRFYENKFPEAEDLVMVRVTRIAEMGAYCCLLEYDNLEGMILMSELSKRRFRSVNKLIKVGRHEVVMVLRVDKEKGYIDLSKRRVSHEDIAKCEDKFSKSKKVHQTVRHVAQKHNISMEVLNQQVVWPLYKKYDHALDALKEAALNANKAFDGMDISDEVRTYLVDDLRSRLSPTALKLQARIHVACFGYDGIDAVKEALLEGKNVGNEGEQEDRMRIKLIAAPRYVVVTSCFDKEEGMAQITKALGAIEGKITSFGGGEYKLQGEITVIGGEDESRVEEIFQEEDSSSGSEDESEEDQGMGLVEDMPPVPEDDDDEPMASATTA